MNQFDQILFLCSQELGGQADPTLGDQSRASFAFSARSTSAMGISIKLQKRSQIGFKEAWREEGLDCPGEGSTVNPAGAGLGHPPALLTRGVLEWLMP